MSACISSHGEYSEHEHGDEGRARFVCQLCGVFDEEAALQRIADLENQQTDAPRDPRNRT